MSIIKMNWNEIKGINLVADFSEIYLESGPINKNLLFNKPQREKYGYLWDISTEQISGVGNINEVITGILIKNDLDARVVLGLYNRAFYNMNQSAILGKLDDTMRFRKTGTVSNGICDEEERWKAFSEILKSVYAQDYIPIKKFLNTPVGDKIWIPIFNSISSLDDKIARKGYYATLKWFMGNNTIILEIQKRYENYWTWANVIEGEGPMENPELQLIENFALKNASSIEYIPKKIVDKLDIGFLGEAGKLGIF